MLGFQGMLFPPVPRLKEYVGVTCASTGGARTKAKNSMPSRTQAAPLMPAGSCENGKNLFMDTSWNITEQWMIARVCGFAQKHCANEGTVAEPMQRSAACWEICNPVNISELISDVNGLIFTGGRILHSRMRLAVLRTVIFGNSRARCDRFSYVPSLASHEMKTSAIFSSFHLFIFSFFICNLPSAICHLPSDI
jgi:hypothetical protein